MITLNTPLPRGKYKGKTLNQINDYMYIGWLLSTWTDIFDNEVITKFGWQIYLHKTKFGSTAGNTNDACLNNQL